MRILASLMFFASSLVVCGTSFAASRYSYDVQKLRAILESEKCEAALRFSTLDGIELLNINNAQKEILYRLKTDNGKCTVDVTLSYRDGMDPDYQVIAVGEKICAR